MLTSGFTNAPVSRVLVLGSVAASLLVSLADAKRFLYIQVVPHLWGYGQFWRLLTWQLCYLNSTELLFASLTFYHLRTVERLWGPRKFASFLLATLPYTTLLPPLVFALVLRPLTFGQANYLPSGPTAIIFALLAQYHAAIPHTYRWRLVTASLLPSALARPTTSTADPTSDTDVPDGMSPPSSDTPPTATTTTALTLTSKTLTYLPALQLCLAAPPGSLLTAWLGFAIGSAYRSDALPGRAAAWRIPDRLFGGRKLGPGHGAANARDGAAGAAGAGGGDDAPEGFEDLRRRLEGERAEASGVEGAEGGREGGGEGRRRTLGGMIAEQFRGGG